MPVVTLLVLDRQRRRGVASSLPMFVGSVANGLVAGVVAPLATGSTLELAFASAALMGSGQDRFALALARVGRWSSNPMP